MTDNNVEQGPAEGTENGDTVPTPEQIAFMNLALPQLQEEVGYDPANRLLRPDGVLPTIGIVAVGPHKFMTLTFRSSTTTFTSMWMRDNLKSFIDDLTHAYEQMSPLAVPKAPNRIIIPGRN